MDDKIQEAIDRIVNGKWISILQKCENKEKALDMLITLVPETLTCGHIFTRRLVCYLQRVYRIDFGVCKFLIIEGNEQFCGADGCKITCNNDILAAFCKRRTENKLLEQPNPPDTAFLDYRVCTGI